MLKYKNLHCLLLLPSIPAAFSGQIKETRKKIPHEAAEKALKGAAEKKKALAFVKPQTKFPPWLSPHIILEEKISVDLKQ